MRWPSLRWASIFHSLLHKPLALPTPLSAPTCRPLLPWRPPTQARDWAWWASHRWPAMKWCERQSESAVHRVAACSGGWCTAPGAAAIQAAHRRRSCSPAPPWAHHLRFLSTAPCLLPHLASQPLAKLSRGGGRADDQEHRHVDSATGVCLPGKGWGQRHATVRWPRHTQLVNCCSDYASCNRSAATPAPSHGLSSASAAPKSSSRYIFWAASCLKRSMLVASSAACKPPQRSTHPPTFSWSSGGRTSMSTARPSSTSSNACIQVRM